MFSIIRSALIGVADFAAQFRGDAALAACMVGTGMPDGHSDTLSKVRFARVRGRSLLQLLPEALGVGSPLLPPAASACCGAEGWTRQCQTSAHVAVGCAESPKYNVLCLASPAFNSK